MSTILPNQMSTLEQIRLMSLLSPLSGDNTVPLGGPGDSQLGVESSPDNTQPYQPKNEAETQLRAMLGQMPQRNQNPGMYRRIAAGLVGAGAMKDPSYIDASERVRDPDYYKNMDAWKEKLDPLKALASAENQQNIYARMTEAERLRDENRDITAAETERKNRATEADRTEQRKNEAQRIAVQDYIAKHPKHQLIRQANGKVLGYDPATDKAVRITDQFGVDATYDSLTPDQRVGIVDKQIAGAMARTKEAGSQARQTQAAGYGFRAELQKARLAAQKEIQTMKSSGSAKGLLPSQQKIARLNKMEQIISENEDLEPYYKLDEKGNVSVKPLDDVDDGDQDTRNRAVDLLQSIGDVEIPAEKSGAKSTAPNAPSGKVHVIGPKGESGWMDESELAKFPGWKKG